MNKRTGLIISLIFSFVGLIYMTLAHYGIMRYFSLHLYDTESYVKPFTQLPKADKNRVVVTFTASPTDLVKLTPFLNSILDQTVRVDDIALTIPYKDMDKVDDKYKKILTVYGYSKDYENAANLVCSVLREPEANTKIIIVEPNMVYGQDFIQSMVEESNQHPDKIIYGNKNRQIKWGVLVQPKFFDDKISNYENGSGCCGWLEKCCKTGGITIDYSEVYRRLN